MPDKAVSSTVAPSQPAVVLAFDPAGRQSSRRRSRETRARRHQRQTDRKQLRAEAESLGVAPEALESDADLHAHYPAVRELEAAYAAGATEGRRALLAIISRYFSQGHKTGLEDAQIEMRQQIMGAVHFRG